VEQASRLRLGRGQRGSQYCATPSPPIEVEEAAGRPHVIIRAKTVNGEKRWKLFGKKQYPATTSGLQHPPEAVPRGDGL
jgi:hypothetical protein